ITGQKDWYGYDACKHVIDKFDKDNVKYPEQANNNLHIWELGDLFSKLAEKMDQGLWTKDGLEGQDLTILAPVEIQKAFKASMQVTTVRDNANIIAALNGPMAHIYVKGSNGWGLDMMTTESNLMYAAEVFRLFMQVDDYPAAKMKLGLSAGAYYTIKERIPNLNLSIDKILIRINGNYQVFNGIGNTLGELTDALGDSGADYVKAMLRIEGLNNLNRSGDIVLVMKDKTAGDVKQRYTIGVACKAWHGSLNPSDSYVPLIVAYPGGTKSTIETLLKRENTCNTDYGGCKGNWNLKGIVQELIKEQYK
ncbi:MAG: hypothetical protein K4571_10065, partial [Deltaproteobacteria bacterium]